MVRWEIDREKRAFVNAKTGEVRAELHVQIAEAHPNRILQGRGKQGPSCRSDDATASLQGVTCASCPRVSEIKVFNEHYEKHSDHQRPPYVGDCSLRYTVVWAREFIPEPRGTTCREHKEKAALSCPKSSIYSLFGTGGYFSKLAQMGHTIDKVVTRIIVKSRQDEKSKADYDFADFECAGLVKETMARVTQTVKV